MRWFFTQVDLPKVRFAELCEDLCVHPGRAGGESGCLDETSEWVGQKSSKACRPVKSQERPVSKSAKDGDWPISCLKGFKRYFMGYDAAGLAKL